MLLLLLFSLILMLFLAFLITKREILSPWVISISMFILSTITAILSYEKWNEDISSITVFVILTGLLSFGIGELISNIFVIRANSHWNIQSQPNKLLTSKMIIIKPVWVLVASAIILMVAVGYFEFIQRISVLAGNQSGIELMLHFARNAQFDENIETNQSFLLNAGITISRTLSYFFIFLFLYNTIFFGYRRYNYIYLIPPLLNLGNILLTTGRTQFINLITVILILMYVMIKMKNNWSKKNDTKILASGIIGIIIFLVVFRLTGYLTGKSDNYSIWENISKYLGASIIALDKYLHNPPDYEFFGKETFSSIYYVFRLVGFNIPYIRVPNEFVSWDNLSNVNVYTSLRRYIQDFGILGMLLIQLFLGVIYGFVFKVIKYRNEVGLIVLIYAMNFFPIVQIAIEERFFMNVISIGGIYNLIAIILIWKVFKRKIKQGNKL